MVLVLVLGDLHVPLRANDLPAKFKKLLVPGKIQQIVCTGNVCDRETWDYLRGVSPDVRAVRGEYDENPSLPPSLVLQHGPLRIGLLHGHQVVPLGDTEALSSVARKMDVDVLVSGGTHRFEAFEYDSRFFVNPGTATGAFSPFWNCSTAVCWEGASSKSSKDSDKEGVRTSAGQAHQNGSEDVPAVDQQPSTTPNPSSPSPHSSLDVNPPAPIPSFALLDIQGTVVVVYVYQLVDGEVQVRNSARNTAGFVMHESSRLNVERTPLQNPPDSPWIVMKFGGTSVGKFLETIASEIIPSYIESGNRVVVVCSARSGETKSTGTTNLLLRAALEALRPRAPDLSSSLASIGNPSTPDASGPSTSEKVNPLTSQIFQRSTSNTVATGTLINGSRSGDSTPSSSKGVSNSLSSSLAGLRMGDETPQMFNATIDQIKNDHIQSARRVIKNRETLKDLEDDLDYDCERLRSFLLAAQIIDEISTRSKDIIIGVGEKLSCRIVTAILRDRGIEAELVSLENIVEIAREEDLDNSDGNLQIGQSFYDKLSLKLGERLQDCGSRVPVVTGFFGVVPGSLLAQVGRGYSDLCAALCAVGLSASELQVWKEVDGIFTADPRKVPTARLLSIITPEEAAELTYYGSEVIHPFTMEQVIRASIPIRIKNVENPSGGGTVIFPDPPEATDDQKDTPMDHFLDEARLSQSVILEQPRRGPTAVTIKDNILVLSIRSNRKTISHGFFAKIFGTLDRYGIIVDLISTSEVHVSMAINGAIRKSILDRIAKDLKTVGEISVIRDMAILSLVGKHMKNMVGIAGRMFSTLAEGNINIEMISQGASEINISCVIEGRDAVKALNTVHHRLLSSTPSPFPSVGPWLY